MDWIIMIIRDLYNAKFFGEVTIKFKDGKIMQVEKRVCLKPPE